MATKKKPAITGLHSQSITDDIKNLGGLIKRGIISNPSNRNNVNNLDKLLHSENSTMKVQKYIHEMNTGKIKGTGKATSAFKTRQARKK